jgi:uncharacterized membrane protein
MKRLDPWLMLIALGALGLRSIALASRPIWYDDAFSLLLARANLAGIVRGTAADTMPPLYYLLLHAWRLVGDSVAVSRMLNVILGIGLVLAVYGLARSVFDTPTARWAALLTAISPIQIYQSQEIRMYVILCLGLVIYLWSLVRIWKGGRRWWLWLSAVVGGTAAAYSHNLAIFSLVAPALFFLMVGERRMLSRSALALAIILLLLAPWLVVIPGQIAKIQAAFWTPRPGLLEVVQAIVLFHGYLPLSGTAQVILLGVSLAAFALTLLIVLRAATSVETGLLLTTLCVPPAALFVVSHFMRPVFVPRAFLLSHVAYLVLAARALVVARPAAARALLGAAFIAAAAVSLPQQYSYRGFPRSPFPEASAWLAETLRPGDSVVHDNKLSYFPMILYAPALPQRFVADEPGSHNDTLAPATQAVMELHPYPSIPGATDGQGRVFFVVFDRAIEEYRSLGLQDHPSLMWLKENLAEVGRTAFGDLWVYEFER